MQVIFGPPDISDLEKKIEKLHQTPWYQRWWGILILGIVASAIVAAVFTFYA
ncbi:MAG: hypothetical protein HY473_00490 [Candidatus Sungbacteria bacterium]|uniref:Uncharacterized protein n=1 Tax=Candidatus Sungiibacteriota bacterium TaxID=2750080 RepID=A0A933DRV9_9BACT|nr:hypothetical protein [Candidatus Sungbacteria bacterium]